MARADLRSVEVTGMAERVDHSLIPMLLIRKIALANERSLEYAKG